VVSSCYLLPPFHGSSRAQENRALARDYSCLEIPATTSCRIILWAVYIVSGACYRSKHALDWILDLSATCMDMVVYMFLGTGFKDHRLILISISCVHPLALYCHHSYLGLSINGKAQRFQTKTRHIWSHNYTDQKRKTNNTNPNQRHWTDIITDTKCISFEKTTIVSRCSWARRL
jgi:hypothetical protein